MCVFSQACSGTTHWRAGNKSRVCSATGNEIQWACACCSGLHFIAVPFFKSLHLNNMPLHEFCVLQSYLICTCITDCRSGRVGLNYFLYLLWIWIWQRCPNYRFKVEGGWTFSYRILFLSRTHPKQQAIQNDRNCRLKPQICKCCIKCGKGRVFPHIFLVKTVGTLQFWSLMMLRAIPFLFLAELNKQIMKENFTSSTALQK